MHRDPLSTRRKTISTRSSTRCMAAICLMVSVPVVGFGATNAELDPDAPKRSSAFGFDDVIEIARALSTEGHRRREMPFEDEFARLSYDQYRDIRFRPERALALPGDERFLLDLLPPGFYFTQPVEVNLIENGTVRKLDFEIDLFDFGPLAPKPANPDALEFSGFRIRHPINRPDVMDEVAVFQGASYFRAVARDLQYGLSARGLAIGTASEDGEEFPTFTRFWVTGEDDDRTTATVLALLESPSVTGAYRFAIAPGAETTMDVEAVLWPRRDLDDVGIAPLTSMFLYDASNRARFDDYRSAVHDSNGVQMINGNGERLWRALANPVELQISTFVDEDPTGFGLVQRSRDFAEYEDAEARYERRPSTWIEPRGDWGRGAVVLVEIPTDLEINDNIVAYWRPETVLRRGERHDYAYRLGWNPVPADDMPLMRVADTRMGQRAQGEDREIVIDFSSPPDGLAVSDEALEPVVTASQGELTHVASQRLDATGQYRVTIGFEPGDAVSSELRVQVQNGAEVVSETWLYRWTS